MQLKDPSFTTSTTSSQTNETPSSFGFLPGIANEEDPATNNSSNPNKRTPGTSSSRPNNATRGSSECCSTQTVAVTVCVIVVLAIVVLAAVANNSSDGSGGRGGFFFLRGGSSGSRGGGGSCFPAGERVLLDNFSQVPIERLHPGSIIHRGGQILAVMKLAADGEDPLHRYNDSVFVTGSHLVQELGGWKPVGESDFATPVEDEQAPTFVYNLISSKHTIMINNTLFADWEEEEDFAENWGLESRILDRLNGHPDMNAPALSSTETVSEGAFQPGTPILLDTGTSVSIEKLEPGDQLQGDDNIVFSVMRLWIPSETMVYHYSMDSSVISVTEWTIVLDDDGLWRNVKHSSNAVAVGLAADGARAWYQLWTTKHQIPVEGGSVFADYEVLDEDDPVFSEEL
ncbi:expressed unknown protein [Seminavis robusta]|uniref:Uncharacterized protein n=1 Tax=Seminavis robusta TaxID=568900 RepID=A0A9N8HGC7_9STRA|nr:expressed unknown protein [Seminavis robusta]|eukprot:Sro503_g155740.1 n/a (400) ;mRNA; r:9136-10335